MALVAMCVTLGPACWDVLHAGYVRDPTLKAAHRRSTRDGAPLPAAKGMLLMATLRT